MNNPPPPNTPLTRQEEFKAALTAYVDEASRIAFKLMEAFSLGLGLPAQALHPAFGVSGMGGGLGLPAQALHSAFGVSECGMRGQTAR